MIQGNLYDFPKYYDLVYGCECRLEINFLSHCFDRYCGKGPKHLLEPACGTGRLLWRLARRGHTVSGLDLNPNAIEFCNCRLDRHGFPQTAFVADMSDFEVDGSFDAAFNTVNSFRLLTDPKLAKQHLRCVANSLGERGVYILGFHLSPESGSLADDESWTARRGSLEVYTAMTLNRRDQDTRLEEYDVFYRVKTPSRSFEIHDKTYFLMYTFDEFESLIRNSGVFKIEDVYDFNYNFGFPIEVCESTEDAIFILRRI
ncbi:MAG: class I SAM-dependent methyltransferase [Planctomycetota bacterium]